MIIDFIKIKNQQCALITRVYDTVDGHVGGVTA